MAVTNEIAINLYKKLGFETVGEIVKNYYNNDKPPDNDAYLMRKYINDDKNYDNYNINKFDKITKPTKASNVQEKYNNNDYNYNIDSKCHKNLFSQNNHHYINQNTKNSYISDYRNNYWKNVNHKFHY